MLLEFLSRHTQLLMKNIKKFLGKLGFSYCRKCGGELFFDEEKFNLGYNVHSRCLNCDNKFIKSIID